MRLIRYSIIISITVTSSINQNTFAANQDTQPQNPKSVYQVSAPIDGSIIGLSALGSLLPYVFADKLIHPFCPCDPQSVNSFDRSVIGNSNSFLDTTSDVSLGIAVLAPPLLDYFDLGASRELLEDLTVYSEVLAVNGAFVTLAKYTVQRPLPLVYAEKAPDLINQPGGYRSFYSGHTSITFASLTATSVTLNLRHHSGVIPWLITVAYGTGVGLERVAAGRHFYTDIMVGALAGTAVGFMVPWFHRRSAKTEKDSNTHFSFVPSDIGFQLTLLHRF